MRKLLAGLLGAIGIAGNAVASPDQTPSATPKTMDPASILFSIATINNDLPPLQPVTQLARNDFSMHEDDWRQLEFYPANRRAEIESTLSDLSAFEKKHRAGSGWTSIYVRKLSIGLALPGSQALQTLSAKLKVAPAAAPVLMQGSSAAGRVANGFTLPISEGLVLYGTSSSNGVSVLGASVAGGDEDLVRVFSALNASADLILVDWTTQMLLLGTGSDGKIEIWTP